MYICIYIYIRIYIYLYKYMNISMNMNIYHMIGRPEVKKGPFLMRGDSKEPLKGVSDIPYRFVYMYA
jgi:hypothetical protein